MKRVCNSFLVFLFFHFISSTAFSSWERTSVIPTYENSYDVKLSPSYERFPGRHKFDYKDFGVTTRDIETYLPVLLRLEKMTGKEIADLVIPSYWFPTVTHENLDDKEPSLRNILKHTDCNSRGAIFRTLLDKYDDKLGKVLGFFFYLLDHTIQFELTDDVVLSYKNSSLSRREFLVQTYIDIWPIETVFLPKNQDKKVFEELGFTNFSDDIEKPDMQKAQLPRTWRTVDNFEEDDFVVSFFDEEDILRIITTRTWIKNNCFTDIIFFSKDEGWKIQHGWRRK